MYVWAGRLFLQLIVLLFFVSHPVPSCILPVYFLVIFWSIFLFIDKKKENHNVKFALKINCTIEVMVIHYWVLADAQIIIKFQYLI